MDKSKKTAEWAAPGRWIPLKFTSSAKYWEERYQRGGNSGSGSFGRLASFKAKVLNGFAAQHNIASVIEFGCGDGNQLTLARYQSYTGVDVSITAVQSCRSRFAQDPTKTFLTLAEYDSQSAELSVSLDVIYHLVEDDVYETYMKMLFDAAERFVIIYSSNRNGNGASPHVRHRCFTDWIEDNRPDFRIKEHIPNRFRYDPRNKSNTTFSDFYVIELRK